eukprot:5164747-Prymnesium_polylepis.1
MRGGSPSTRQGAAADHVPLAVAFAAARVAAALGWCEPCGGSGPRTTRRRRPRDVFDARHDAGWGSVDRRVVADTAAAAVAVTPVRCTGHSFASDPRGGDTFGV